MGVDLRTSLRLSFMEAVNGASKDVVVTYVTPGENGRPSRKTKTVSVDIPPGEGVGGVEVMWSVLSSKERG